VKALVPPKKKARLTITNKNGTCTTVHVHKSYEMWLYSLMYFQMVVDFEQLTCGE
jgi:hypothetical protein